MKALMTNSTHPDIFAAKIRDQMYIKHLRQVQRINNRQAIRIKSQLKQYSHVYQSHQKSRKQANQFSIGLQNNQIQKKNQQMNIKMKNIRSMFNFNHSKKTNNKSQSTITENNQIIFNKQIPNTYRYAKQNQETQQIHQISQQISTSIAHGISKSSKAQQLKSNRLSLHYYLRKRQQQMIEHENEKLKKGILTQKSVYSSPSKKLNRSIKLPTVKSARHNFNERTMHIQSTKDNNEIITKEKNKENEQQIKKSS